MALENEIDRQWREIRRRSGISQVMRERPDTEPEAHVLFRGMYDQPRERVAAGTPAALPPMSESFPTSIEGMGNGNGKHFFRRSVAGPLLAASFFRSGHRTFCK